jgi:hypothetical protein
MMTQAERNQVKAETLLEIADVLNSNSAAGPTHYWFRKLAEWLSERAQKIRQGS